MSLKMVTVLDSVDNYRVMHFCLELGTLDPKQSQLAIFKQHHQQIFLYVYVKMVLKIKENPLSPLHDEDELDHNQGKRVSVQHTNNMQNTISEPICYRLTMIQTLGATTDVSGLLLLPADIQITDNWAKTSSSVSHCLQPNKPPDTREQSCS